MKYKWHTGSIAWIIHRVSGILLLLYIFLHLYVLSNLKDPQKFESIMKAMDNPFVKIGEAGLLFLVIAHSLNGIRLTLLDIGTPTKYQKLLFRAAAIIGGIIFLIGAWPIMGGGY
ncbi:MAG TPA: succinate dehydrogenase, cytochrome b556 subunit [Nitrospirae bacterium]|nr:succinate dehydrogenase cytochrome b556 large membrane subunit [bacterium BMS3Abin06]HDH10798.1 succinate dehydrogenase, cytochrome b556 subunit [Nitrospirota bacterium]HDZ00958.1 succinate dehydrogenase, cytochrome b556 subunit [Nitrospirota bacterium]